MDPATIAAGAAALLSPYLKKAGEEFAGEAGKYVQEKARDLWQKIRAKLDGDPPARVVLDKFEANPDAHVGEFTVKVQEKIAADKPLADEISAGVADVKRNAPYVRVVQRIKEAEDVVGVKANSLKTGTVDLDQALDVAKGKIVGVDIGDIG
jgi:hypothetical protein